MYFPWFMDEINDADVWKNMRKKCDEIGYSNPKLIQKERNDLPVFRHIPPPPMEE